MSPQYWAGFFDGEGNIDLRFRETHGGKYKRFELRLAIAQVYSPVLELMQSEYGGSIWCGKSGVSRLVIASNEARRFLEEIQPFCIVKKDELQIALDFFNVVDNTPAHHRPGQRFFNRTPVEVQEKKIVLFHAMRDARIAKGLKSKAREGVRLPYAA